jgi:hypothetical protein
MVCHHHEATSRSEEVERRFHEAFDSRKFIVDSDSESLEDLSGGVSCPPPCGRY